jgi:hypothetical protein
MPRQKNVYILNLKNGGEARAVCSTLDEAKLVARHHPEEVLSVQRVYKNAPRICHNVRGKVHSV